MSDATGKNSTKAAFNDFRSEIEKPKEIQDKSKIIEFWGDLVKLLPEAVKLKDALGGLIG